MSLPLLALPVGDQLSRLDELRMRRIDEGIDDILFNQRLAAMKQDMPGGPGAAGGAKGRWVGRDVKEYNCLRCRNTGSSRRIVWVVSEEVGFGVNGKQYELWPVGYQKELYSSVELAVYCFVGLGLVAGLVVGVVMNVL